MKWKSVSKEEQETIINIDYYDKTISLYTTKQSVANRLKKKIGAPTNINEVNGIIYSVEYKMSILDERVRKLIAKTTLITQVFEKNKNN